MSSVDSSLDIICLSQPPLHVTPLFRYIKEGKVCHCVPLWCDISFFIDKVQQESQWIPRCKIYELQMMGVMENEASDARIPRLHLNNYGKTLVEIMDEYDSAVFKPIKRIPKPAQVEFKQVKPKFQAPELKKCHRNTFFNV